MPTSYQTLLLLWFLYLGSHSFFASVKVKKIAERIMGKGYGYYRIIYVFLSTLLLVLLGIYLLMIKPVWILQRNLWITYTGIAFGTWGIIIIKRAFEIYDLGEFIGTSYLPDKGTVQNSLKTSGILSYIRHPLYAGTLLIAAGFLLIMPSEANLVSVICITIYLLIGIRLEEDKLLTDFGKRYQEYKNQTPMLFPRISDIFKKKG